MTFNKAVVVKMELPDYVLLYINEDEKQIAIQACDKNCPKAVPFYKEKKSGLISARWNGKDLMNTIIELTGWDLDKNTYRVDGTLIKKENAMIFDLKKPSISEVKDIENK